MKNFPVGTKVQAKHDFPALKVRKGEIGFVYEVYEFNDKSVRPEGVSIIFEKGAYDRFSIDEQKQFLENLGIDSRYEHYRFTGIINMYADYMDGFWKFGEEQNG